LAAEIQYVGTIDQDKLSDLEKLAILARAEELKIAREILEAHTSVVIDISRCLPLQPRIPPPGPCPIIEGVLASIPTGTYVNLDLLGVFMDIPQQTEFRIAASQSGMLLTTKDGKDVFAYGSLNSYDQLFHTAWYHFDVKNPALANTPLVLKISTAFISDNQIKNWYFEVDVPEGTFLTE
jgi:hypothetical protein